MSFLHVMVPTEDMFHGTGKEEQDFNGLAYWWIFTIIQCHDPTSDSVGAAQLTPLFCPITTATLEGEMQCHSLVGSLQT